MSEGPWFSQEWPALASLPTQPLAESSVASVANHKCSVGLHSVPAGAVSQFVLPGWRSARPITTATRPRIWQPGGTKPDCFQSCIPTAICWDDPTSRMLFFTYPGENWLKIYCFWKVMDITEKHSEENNFLKNESSSRGSQILARVIHFCLQSKAVHIIYIVLPSGHVFTLNTRSPVPAKYQNSQCVVCVCACLYARVREMCSVEELWGRKQRDPELPRAQTHVSNQSITSWHMWS